MTFRPRITLVDCLAMTTLCAILFAVARTAIHRADYFGVSRLSASADGRWLSAVYHSGRVAVWDCSSPTIDRIPTSARGPRENGYYQYLPTAGTHWVGENTMIVLNRERRLSPLVEFWNVRSNIRQHSHSVRGLTDIVSVSDDGRTLLCSMFWGPEIVTFDASFTRLTSRTRIAAPAVRPLSEEQIWEARILGENRLRFGIGEPYDRFRSDTPSTRFVIFDMDAQQEIATWSLPDGTTINAVSARGDAMLTTQIQSNSSLQLSLVEFDDNGEFRSTRAIGSLPPATGPLAIAPDLKSIARLNHSDAVPTLELYSCNDLKLLAEHDMIENCDKIAFVRENLIVTSSQSTCTAWLYQNDKLTAQELTHASHAQEIIASIVGLVAWGIGWGLILRRRPPMGHSAMALAPREFTVRIFGLFNQRLIRGLAALLLGWLVTCYFYPGADWAELLIGIALGTFVGYIILRPMATVIQGLVRLLFSTFPIERKRLQRIASLPVHESEWGAMRMCYVGNSRIERLVTVERNRVQHAWRTWMREEPPTECRSLLLGFERYQDLHAYCGRPISVPAFYASQYGHRMLVCEELLDLHLASPSRTLRVLFALFYSQLKRGTLLPIGLQWLINARLVADEDLHPSASRAVRRLRSVWSQGHVLQPLSLFDMKADDLAFGSAHRFQRTPFLRTAYHLDLATAWAELFTGPTADDEQRGRFAKLVTMMTGLDARAHLENCFQTKVERLEERWHAWLRSFEMASAIDDMETDLISTITAKALPTIADPNAPWVDRQAYVLSLGIHGAGVAGESLVTLLEQLTQHSHETDRTNITGTLTDDTLWSLRAVTGADCGRDVDRWRATLEGLLPARHDPTPTTVVGPSVGPTKSSLSDVSATCGQVDSPIVSEVGMALRLEEDRGVTDHTALMTWQRPNRFQQWLRRGPVVQAWHVAWNFTFVIGLWAIGYNVFATIDHDNRFTDTANQLAAQLVWLDVLYLPRFVALGSAAVGIAMATGRVRAGLSAVVMIQLVAATLCCDVLTAAVSLATIVALRRG